MGPQALFEEVRAELERRTGRVACLGGLPDHAAVLKLMGNVLINGVVGLLADALTLARSAGRRRWASRSS